MNNGTELKDRFLSFDGTSIVKPEVLLDMIYSGVDVEKLYTSEMTDDIREYNSMSMKPLKLKESIDSLSYDWNIPEDYKTLDVVLYVINKYVSVGDISDARYGRLLFELKKFKKLGLFDFIRTLIYISDTFKQESVVRGVGRGSSVASYVLFVIDIHMIDSFKYGLEFGEFIRDEEFK